MEIISKCLICEGGQYHAERGQSSTLFDNLGIESKEVHDVLMNEIGYAEQYFKNIEFDGSVLYYGGWISKRTIAWLKTLKNTPVTIFPDYDPVGLNNYLLLKKALPDLEIYIPENLADLLIRYGDPKRLESSTDRTLIEQTTDEKASFLYSLLLKHGVGLHQEGLMLGD
jgi:hypothetical protein